MTKILNTLIEELNKIKTFNVKFPTEFKVESGDYHDFKYVADFMKEYMNKKFTFNEIEEDVFDELKVNEYESMEGGRGYYAHFKMK